MGGADWRATPSGVETTRPGLVLGHRRIRPIAPVPAALHPMRDRVWVQDRCNAGSRTGTRPRSLPGFSTAAVEPRCATSPLDVDGSSAGGGMVMRDRNN